MNLNSHQKKVDEMISPHFNEVEGKKEDYKVELAKKPSSLNFHAKLKLTKYKNKKLSKKKMKNFAPFKHLENLQHQDQIRRSI